MTWLLAARAFLGGIPKWAWVALGIVVAVIAFMVWLDAREDAAVNADRAVSNAEAVSKGREADEGAHEASTGKIEEVRHGNERAREAATSGDDPLRDALDSLRSDETD